MSGRSIDVAYCARAWGIGRHQARRRLLEIERDELAMSETEKSVRRRGPRRIIYVDDVLYVQRYGPILKRSDADSHLLRDLRARMNELEQLSRAQAVEISYLKQEVAAFKKLRERR